MTTLLQVRDVSCAKDKEHTIFNNLSFDVNEGDVVILQGKSGSGWVILSFNNETPLTFKQENHSVEMHFSFERVQWSDSV